ncbi:MAG: trehalose-phosphatase [Candidatus Omnitrophica bacterium]|nr:trehalose-phosphatase [Candidatus Omnitrophota bacterium]
MKHLFSHLKEVFSRIEKKPVFLFLDFDGTLAPLAPTPQEAFLPANIYNLIKRLAALPMVRLAIISGREMNDLKRKVGIEGIIYSGNHGLECDYPEAAFGTKIDPLMLKRLSDAGRKLRQKLSAFPGVVFEDKTYSLSVHYRNVPVAQRGMLKQMVESVLEPYVKARQFVLEQGKMVVEVRLDMDWHKGKIARSLMDRFPGSTPIYIGDDRTDEDAFAVVRPQGLAVFVGDHNKDSQAEYFLNDTLEVQKFLEFIDNHFRQDR